MPLGAAVTLAAVLLPAGGRAALGVVLAVIGFGAWAVRQRSVAKRMGAPLIAMVAATAGAAGLTLLAATVIAELRPDGGPSETVALDGLLAIVPPLALLGLLVWLGVDRRWLGGRKDHTLPKAHTIAIGTLLGLVVAVAIGWIGGGPRDGTDFGEGRDASLIATVVVAVVLTVAAVLATLRGGGGTAGSAPGRSSAWSAVADVLAVAALVLLLLLGVGDVSGIVGSLHDLVPGGGYGTAPALLVAGAGTVASVSAAVLLVARWRSGAAVPLVAVVTLLFVATVPTFPDDRSAGVLLVELLPALLLVGVAVALRWPPAGVRRRLPGGVRPAGAWALAPLVVAAVLVALWLRPLVEDAGPRVALQTLLLVVVALVALRAPGGPAQVATMALLAALVVAWPWTAVFDPALGDLGQDGTTQAEPASTLGELLVAVGPLVLLAPIVATLVRRARSGVVDGLAAAAGAVGVSYGLMALIVGLPLTAADGIGTGLITIQPLVTTSFAVGLGLAALVGPGRAVPRLQVAAASALLVAAAALLGIRVLMASDEPTIEAARTGIAAAGGLALLAATLLAASTARRASPWAAFAATVATAAGALMVAAGTVETTGHDLLAPGPVDLLYGADVSSGVLQHARPGWPILLAVLGAMLVAVATILERSRPAPAGAAVRVRPGRR